MTGKMATVTAATVTGATSGLGRADRIRAYAMGVMLIGSGTAHFAIPATFDWMIPVELPGSQRLYTYGSGLAETAAGTLLLAKRTRQLGAMAAVAVFVSVFPANLNGVRLWWDRPWPMRMVPIVRLPLQVPLIKTALQIRRTTINT